MNGPTLSKTAFISYAHKDEALKEEFIQHFAALEREGLISAWHDRGISPGSHLDNAINEKLDSCDVIILLLSPSFIASDYCSEREMVHAFKRSQARQALTISVIVRPCQWQLIPLKSGGHLGDFLGLPRDGQPVTMFDNHDAAWDQVIRGIRDALNRFDADPKPKAISGASRPSTPQRPLDDVDEAEGQEPTIHSFGDVLRSTVEHIAETYVADPPPGISFGLSNLDRRTGRIGRNELVVLGARPGNAASDLAATIAVDCARTYTWKSSEDGRQAVDGGTVLYFCVNEEVRKFATNVIARATEISPRSYSVGNISAEDFGKVRDAALELSSIPLYLNYDAENIEDIEKAIQNAFDHFNLDLVIIDDVNSLQSDRGAKAARNVHATLLRLRKMCRRLGLACVSLVHLDPSVDRRENPKPALTDLDQFEPLSEPADRVILTYREAFYLSKREPDTVDLAKHLIWQEKMDKCWEDLWIEVAKSPAGPAFMTRFSYNDELRKITDIGISY